MTTLQNDSASGPRTRSHRRVLWFPIGAAVLWSSGLLVAALKLPTYEGDVVYGGTRPGTGDSYTIVTHHSETLVANDRGMLLVVALPLVASLIVAVALLGRHRTRSAHVVARAVAWAAAGVCGLVTMLGMLTIGPFLVPAAACLAAACALEAVGAGSAHRNLRDSGLRS